MGEGVVHITFDEEHDAPRPTCTSEVENPVDGVQCDECSVQSRPAPAAEREQKRSAFLTSLERIRYYYITEKGMCRSTARSKSMDACFQSIPRDVTDATARNSKLGVVPNSVQGNEFPVEESAISTSRNRLKRSAHLLARKRIQEYYESSKRCRTYRKESTESVFPSRTPDGESFATIGDRGPGNDQLPSTRNSLSGNSQGKVPIPCILVGNGDVPNSVQGTEFPVEEGPIFTSRNRLKRPAHLLARKRIKEYYDSCKRCRTYRKEFTDSVFPSTTPDEESFAAIGSKGLGNDQLPITRNSPSGNSQGKENGNSQGKDPIPCILVGNGGVPNSAQVTEFPVEEGPISTSPKRLKSLLARKRIQEYYESNKKCRTYRKESTESVFATTTADGESFATIGGQGPGNDQLPSTRNPPSGNSQGKDPIPCILVRNGGVPGSVQATELPVEGSPISTSPNRLKRTAHLLARERIRKYYESYKRCRTLGERSAQWNCTLVKQN